MDSRSLGYSYNYSFVEAGLHEIISPFKLMNLDKDRRCYFFEIRTEFFIVWRDHDEEREIIGSERYDVSGGIPIVDAAKSARSLRFQLWPRLNDYWMSKDVMTSFCNDAIAFAQPIAAQCESSNGIAIVINLEVNTVQQDGESVKETAQRAIMPYKLLPSYLWCGQSVVHKPLPDWVKDFLFSLSKVRVDNTETGLALMDGCCPVCLRPPYVGDVITKLRTCGCVFHHHCIVMELEANSLCPQCDSPAYDPTFLKGLSISPKFFDL